MGIIELARRAKVPKEAVSAVFDALKGVLDDGEVVKVIGFGTFTRKVKSASTRKSPLTGDTPIEIPARSIIKFKCGKDCIYEV